MRNLSLSAAVAFIVLLATVATRSDAHATSFDGNQNLICSAIDTVQCEGFDGSCIQGRAQDVNIPQFFRLNFDEMIIRRETWDGVELISKIESLRSDSGELILQGVELGLGWTLLVNESSGRMTITASADDAAFVIFGACALD